MACGGRLQTVERLGRHANRSVIASRALGGTNIVVDGLGNTYQLDASLLSQTTQDRKTAITTNADQRIGTGQPKTLDKLLRSISFASARPWEGKGVTLVR